MNAATSMQGNKANAFKWLLKREFWENRGGFLWAPVITGAIITVLSFIAAAIGVIRFFQFKKDSDFDLNIDSDMLEHARQLGSVGDGFLVAGIGLTQIVLAFVVFFYALGTLYDDRRDRSILFWKSLPVSDSHMVLSKAAWALILAPLLSIAIGVVVGLALWLIGAVSAGIMGVPAGWAMLTHAHPLSVIGNIVSTVPLYLLWALPTVGWLMFCSAWSRSKPFLWAVLVPVLACVIISMLGILGIRIPYGPLWYTVVYRGLLSVMPGTWSPLSAQHAPAMAHDVNSPADLVRMMNPAINWHVFTTADLWIGAVIGVVLIFAAIHLRRWRESE